MGKLYGVVGVSSYDQLLADPQGADVISIPCKPGNGVVRRGTVMCRESTGLYSPATAAQIVNTNMLVVINETVATGEAVKDGEVATAEDAAAYRAGRFINGRVVLAGDGELTAAHKIVLRQQGIVFEEKESAKTFNNTVENETTE